MLDLLRTLHKEYNTTFVYVTHDEREALSIASHIAVLSDGKICQYGKTIDIIKKPSSPKVANIIGGWNILSIKKTSKAPNIAELSYNSILPNNSDFSAPERVIQIGIPISATTFTNFNSRDEPGYISLPVKVVNITPWYQGFRVECLYRESAHIYSYCDHVDFNISAKGYIYFRKEDIHVFCN